MTAVAMPELTRGSLWSALKSRHCYATTGERILLTFKAGSASMGDEIRVTQLPAFEVAVEGTAPIEAIDFFRGDLCVASVDPMSASTAWSDSVRIAWTGAAAPGNWQRARMQWDGELRVAGARILAAHPWAFDTPDEGLRHISDTRVAWRSLTAGDWDGLVLDLDRFDGAELTFVTALMTLQSRIDDLAAHPRTFRRQRADETRGVATPAREVAPAGLAGSLRRSGAGRRRARLLGARPPGRWCARVVDPDFRHARNPR
ncbi:MAG: hypothetical protein IPI27_12390 [Betaproteobacteria bacterium]|nr:hypothetical protein [Betaproteobacteria bacterium]